MAETGSLSYGRGSDKALLLRSNATVGWWRWAALGSLAGRVPAGYQEPRALHWPSGHWETHERVPGPPTAHRANASPTFECGAHTIGQRHQVIPLEAAAFRQYFGAPHTDPEEAIPEPIGRLGVAHIAQQFIPCDMRDN